MRILVLSPRQVWPVNTGAKLREFHLEKQLAKNAEISLLAFTATPDEDGRRELSFFEEVITVEPPPPRTIPQLIRGAIGSQPLPVVAYDLPRMHTALQQLLSRKQFDIVQLESVHMNGYVRILREHGIPVVFDWHNIESELMSRYSRRNGTKDTSWAHRLYARITAGRLETAEQYMLHQPRARHLVCSQREAEQLQRIAPGAFIHVIPNGVDTRYFSEESIQEAYGCLKLSPSAGKTRLLFVGSMDYHANIEGAVDFVRRIWPEIRARYPDLEFKLVGSNPTQAVMELAREPGVVVTGTVPDLRPYYAEAVAALAPLKTGGGTRLKILEALAAGAPVISTAAGAEGLDLVPGRHYHLAETVSEWLAAIELVLHHPARKQAMIEAGHAFVNEYYDWDVIGRQLWTIYENALERRPT